jgi:DNA-binding NarL/FixJ family response regulator
MHSQRHPLASLALAALASLALHAPARAHTPPTRAQVLADYDEAARTGDLLAPGDSGMTLRERHPERYPAAAAVAAAGKSRAQVVAETREEIRTGDVLALGDSGVTLNEAFPERYAKARMATAHPNGGDRVNRPGGVTE